ncbi:hypothetical protein EYV94_20280 [Puteibacter caeruleilacunae]|nr:hypothetical protein EYV94_20280 [Puteibacter caeruleilacunae]
MKLHLIYFSPGGTTQQTVRKVAEGITQDYQVSEIVEYDMLDKENRQRQYHFSNEDLVILGMMTLVQPFGPVDEIFQAIKGSNTPLVGIVLFGNGMYGNSLKVMRRQVKKRGFNMIAAGAFIGKMSYNTRVAANRPDQQDLIIQFEFGRNIARKLQYEGKAPLHQRLKTDWPEWNLLHSVKTALLLRLPLGKFKVPKPFNSIQFTDSCIDCGKCQRRCPVGAIDLSEKQSDSTQCIGCLACVNGCVNNGIVYTNSLMRKAADDCEHIFAKRREPVVYL